MKVTVNGERREVDDRATVAELVAQLAGARRTGIAVAVNGEVVPRGRWPAVTVAADDAIEVLSAIGGG